MVEMSLHAASDGAVRPLLHYGDRCKLLESVTHIPRCYAQGQTSSFVLQRSGCEKTRFVPKIAAKTDPSFPRARAKCATSQ